MMVVGEQREYVRDLPAPLRGQLHVTLSARAQHLTMEVQLLNVRIPTINVRRTLIGTIRTQRSYVQPEWAHTFDAYAIGYAGGQPGRRTPRPLWQTRDRIARELRPYFMPWLDEQVRDGFKDVELRGKQAALEHMEQVVADRQQALTKDLLQLARIRDELRTLEQQHETSA